MNLQQTVDMLFQRKLDDRLTFRGLKISVETDKGSVREGTDKNGHNWSVKMKHPYGYIRMSEGADGEHVDCYVGPNEDAEKVYVIHQNDPDTGKYDEDKCMLGFDSPEEAKEAYLVHYDKPGFFGSMDEMTFEEFKEAVFSTKDEPGKIEANVPTPLQSTSSLYMDVQPTTKPPSSENFHRVPDPNNPNEKDDRFLDVTKRDDPETQKWRAKLTTKSTPKPLSWNRVYQPVTQESVSVPYGTILRGRR